jgi:hypothetical protein
MIRQHLLHSLAWYIPEVLPVVFCVLWPDMCQNSYQSSCARVSHFLQILLSCLAWYHTTHLTHLYLSLISWTPGDQVGVEVTSKTCIQEVYSEILACTTANPTSFVFSCAFAVKYHQSVRLWLLFSKSWVTVQQTSLHITERWDKEKTVNSSKMSVSTLKTTQCQPRRPTMKLSITMKKNSFYLTKLLEVYGFLGHDAK